MSRFASCALVLALLTPGAIAQPEGPRPGGRDPGALMERIMQADTDADGIITAEEAEASPLLARILERADANADGSLDKSEIEVFIASRAGGPARGPGGDEAPATFEDDMSRAGRAMRALSRAEYTEANLASNLESSLTLQAALFDAKRKSRDIAIAEPAREKYGDRARIEVRRWFNKAIRAALAVEDAILDNDAELIAANLDKLDEVRDEAHDLFQSERPW